MAQTNFTPISLYYSATAAAVPTAGNLVAGELAINTADGKLFYKDSAGVVQTIASKDINSGVFPAGTVSAPSITFTGDTNTGIYSPAADTIAFTEGGVESMRINSSGNVGIGTNSPAEKLDVVGNVKITGALLSLETTLNYANIEVGGALGAYIDLKSPASDDYDFRLFTDAGGTQLATNGAVPLIFNTNTTERMRITSAGNVGIGTSSPSSPLQVSTAGVNNTLQITSTDANGGFGATMSFKNTGTNGLDYWIMSTSAADGGVGAGNLRFYDATNNATRMTINSSGNLRLVNNLSVGNATPTTSGTGITFPATQSASSDANTLDDYEEGDWTPVVTSQTGSLTAYTSSGKYTKIGNTVYVSARFTITTVGTAGGFANISGYPFTSRANQAFNGSAREAASTGNLYNATLEPNATNGIIGGNANAALVWATNYDYNWNFTYQV